MERSLSSTVLVLLAIAGAVSGCVGGQANINPFAGREASTPIKIVVNNQNFNQGNVFAVTPRGVRDLGSIAGSSWRTFTLDWYERGELRIRVEFPSSRNLNSNFVSASPGEWFTLTVQGSGRSAQLRRGT